MYCEYCIRTDQRGLTVQNDLHFRVVQVQLFLVVKEVYSFHIFSFLKGPQLNFHHRIDYSLQHTGVVVVVNVHLFSYG